MKDNRKWECTDDGTFYCVTLTHKEDTFKSYINKLHLEKSLFPNQVLAFHLKILNNQLCNKYFPIRGYGYGYS